MSEHEHPHDSPRRHDVPPSPVPLLPDDAGATALSDALRSSFFIVKIAMVLLVVFFFASGMFTVGPQERVVLLRFGKPVGQGDDVLLGPGFHWAFPAPIDEKVRIPFTQVMEARSSAGWYATTPELEAARTEPPPRNTLDPRFDSYLLTGDANIIHVRAVLRYRIADPIRYVFGFTNAAAAVTNALDNALFYAAARFRVDDALRQNVAAFSETVARRINDVAEQQQLGIAVEQVALTSLIPPRQLAENFRAVLEASIRTERQLNQARSYANEALSRATGEASARLGAAQGERNRLVEAVAAEARRFQDLLPKYREDPELFVQLRQAEVVQRVITNAQERVFVPARADGKSRTLRLDLGREPQRPKPAPEPPMEDRH